MLSEKEMDKILKDNKVSDKFLTGVKLVGTDQEAPLLLVKTAIVPYLELFDEKIKSIVNYKTDYIRVRFIEEADEAAEKLDRQSLANLLETIATSFGGRWYIPYGRYATGAQISRLITKMREWASWSEYGTNGRKNIIIVRSALLLSDTKEAILKLDKDNVLFAYSTVRNVSVDLIRDQVLFDFGFDENGQIEYELGGKELLVQLEVDFTVRLFDKTAQKIVKSVPKKDVDLELAERVTKEIADIKKNLKKSVQNRIKELRSRFLDGNDLDAEIWVKMYTHNPVLKQIARSIVWKQGEMHFILGENGAIDCEGNSYSVQTNSEITVAHPMEMTKKNVKKWQAYFTNLQIEQPFEQMWEPVIKESEVKPDRYKGKLIPYHQFLHKENHGITVLDQDYHDNITFYLADCTAEIERKNWRRHDINFNDLFEIIHISFKTYTRRTNHIIAYLDKVTETL